MMKITGDCKPEIECEEHLVPVKRCTQKVEVPCADAAPFGMRTSPWLVWLAIAVLVFVLVLIMLWVIDPRDLRKDDDGEYCDEKDLVKYLVISLIAAVIAVAIVYGACSC
jgi:p-aminobenzoyl-glutamate transporter AbgT